MSPSHHHEVQRPGVSGGRGPVRLPVGDRLHGIGDRARVPPSGRLRTGPPGRTRSRGSTSRFRGNKTPVRRPGTDGWRTAAGGGWRTADTMTPRRGSTSSRDSPSAQRSRPGTARSGTCTRARCGRVGTNSRRRSSATRGTGRSVTASVTGVASQCLGYLARGKTSRSTFGLGRPASGPWGRRGGWSLRSSRRGRWSAPEGETCLSRFGCRLDPSAVRWRCAHRRCEVGRSVPSFQGAGARACWRLCHQPRAGADGRGARSRFDVASFGLEGDLSRAR